jgi:hypothetical protein
MNSQFQQLNHMLFSSSNVSVRLATADSRVYKSRVMTKVSCFRYLSERDRRKALRHIDGDCLVSKFFL